MPVFSYKAIDPSGKTVENELEAKDRQELIKKLNELALSPLELKEKTHKSPPGAAGSPMFFGGKRVSRKNITQFSTQLSALIHANMNLAHALKALEQQSPNEGMLAILHSLHDDVEKGKNLSDALTNFPQHFNDLYLNIIKVGEIGGVLDEALQRIVQMRTSEEELIGKIKGALAYPCMMAIVMVGSIIVMLTFVIPKFSGVFSQMGTSLPFSTKVVMGTSDFLQSWWWLVLIMLLMISSGLYFLMSQKKYRLIFDKFKLKIPILGRIIMEMSISRFSLALGALLSSGVSMMKALDATRSITGNLFIESNLQKMAEEVREGGSLSSTLRKRDLLFPSLMIGMIGTGEEAGNLDEMLNNIGEYYRKESEEKINTLTTLFEPVLIIIMGGIVGFIVSAILLPIFDVSTSIH